MVALTLASMMCLSVFIGLQTISKLALNVAVRSEAHRLLQAEAERLDAAAYDDFAAHADETITGALKTSFTAGHEAHLTYPANNADGRVTFTRRVVEVASTGTSRTLRVEVEWTWQHRHSVISTPLFRSR